MDIGSEAHKELFVQAFLDAHHRYAVKDLPWPDLDGEELALLRGLPFWTHALEFESAAGPMIQSVAREFRTRGFEKRWNCRPSRSRGMPNSWSS